MLGSPYQTRRQQLETLGLEGTAWCTPPYSIGSGEAMLRLSKEQGFEGIVAKRLGSRYEPGMRSGAWTKVKNYKRQELVIGGWIPHPGRHSTRVDGLVLGYWRELEFVSAGTVKIGFTHGLRVELPQLLGAIRRESSPFARGEVPAGRSRRAPACLCRCNSSSGRLTHNP